VSRILQLGRRGQGWFLLQLLLIAAIAGSSFTGIYCPLSVQSFPTVSGIVVAFAGLVVLVVGVTALGRSFTPPPRPHSRAEFHERGPYRFVRHPIYAGVILAAFGWSFAEAPVALAPSGLRAVLFDLKSRREEQLPVGRSPSYAAYRGGGTPRFVPLLY